MKNIIGDHLINMGKIITTKIDRFDGGITEDKRSTQSNKFSLTKHFDALTYPHKLVPYRSTEADETKAAKIVNFLYAPYGNSTAFKLYGLGVHTTSKVALYTYDIDTALDSSWSGGSYFLGVNTNRDTEVLFYYKDYIYVFSGNGRYLETLDITTATNNFANYQDFTAAGAVAQPVHHPADDIAYFFRNNLVHSLNVASWDKGAEDPTAGVLVLPSNMNITAACAYGNYLAIACVTKGGSDYSSVVYLWDRDSSLATLTERIDFGKGGIVHLANLDNKLIAVMDYQAQGAKGALARGKILIKQAVGQFGITINELLMDTAGSSATLPRVRSLQDNKLYFVARPTLNGDTRNGIWVVDSSGRLALDFVEEEATAYNGIAKVGNAWFIAHSDDGSVNRSNDAEVYAHTSIYESLIFNNGNSSITKELKKVRLTTEPLVANDTLSLILKYRKDEDILAGSWTTILTRATANANDIRHQANNIESSGAFFPQYKEIQFRIEAKSGSTAPSITGLEFESEIIDNQL